MRTQLAYCSACDRQVEVLVPDDLPEGTLPTAHDPSVCICLAYGVSCTGSMCPLFEVPTEQMAENLRRTVGRQDEEGEGETEAEPDSAPEA